jgi:long-chain acyl-CoA synthetase
VDDAGNPLPANTIGDIEVRTPRTLTAYLGQTRAAELRPDGFFHLGDLGYIDDEGDLFVTGRSKDMIISGGVNIFPAEIEAALMQHPAILDAAAFGVPHADMGEQVAAICEIKPGHSRPSTDELLTFAAQHLAPFKRPRVLEFTDELPRNTTGKVLKGELAAPYWEDLPGTRAAYDRTPR